MLLVVDIGNTHIVMGVFNKEELSRNWRVSTISTRTSDEWFAQVMAFANSADFRKGDISDVAVSSVVPEVTFSFKKMAGSIRTILWLQPFRYSETHAGRRRRNRCCRLLRDYTLPCRP